MRDLIDEVSSNPPKVHCDSAVGIVQYLYFNTVDFFSEFKKPKFMSLVSPIPTGRTTYLIEKAIQLISQSSNEAEIIAAISYSRKSPATT